MHNKANHNKQNVNFYINIAFYLIILLKAYWTSDGGGGFHNQPLPG